jgi:phosphate starvation-inducible protein PhoH
MTKNTDFASDINQKMGPGRPLLDVLREYYTQAEITHMLDEQIIEIAPFGILSWSQLQT